MEKTKKTFSELMKYWKEINGYDVAKCKQIFISFDKWVYKGSIPRESNVDMICEKTGFKREEVLEAIEESKNQKILAEQGREQIRKYNLKYNRDVVIPKPEPEVPKTEPIVEATKEGTLDFDMVLKDYISYTKEKDKLMEEFLAIKDKLEKVKAKLTETRELLKKCV